MSFFKFTCLMIALGCVLIEETNSLVALKSTNGNMGIQKRGAPQVPNPQNFKWPNGIVPYVLDPTYSQKDKDLIISGFKYVEESTRLNGVDCIKVVPRTNESNYIQVKNEGGCSSRVGTRSRPGPQDLKLKSPGCMVKRKAAHELIHALGFWHEISRPDRDEYVKINYNNIEEEFKFAFDKYNSSQIVDLDTPYDYESIMHYGAYHFAIDKSIPTIVPLKPYNSTLGNKPLSPIDIEEIRKYYNCA